MKRKAFLLFILFIALNPGFSRPRYVARYAEKHGDQLNVGLGIGYTGIYSSSAVVHLNYEFDVARNFTLAPFITLFSYQYSNDVYKETVIPFGVKGAYYFDELLRAGPRWDFYGAGSLGFRLINRTWFAPEPRRSLYASTSNLYLDLHVGARLHLSRVVGLFLDLSTGISTLGLTFSF